MFANVLRRGVANAMMSSSSSPSSVVSHRSSSVFRRHMSNPVPQVNTSALFAVVHIAGHQYKVSVGDVVTTMRIVDANVGDDYRCDKVLAVGSSNFTLLGTPLVPNAIVTLSIEEQTRADKILVFKKKRRKRYERQLGHRQDVTTVRVTAIETPTASQTAPVSLKAPEDEIASVEPIAQPNASAQSQ